MKIVVISNIPLDSIYANAINVFKMADGFSKLGHKVTILCRNPLRKEFLKSNFLKKFSLSKNIEIKTFRFIKIFYLIDSFLFAAQIIIDIYKLKPNLVYARDYIAPCITSLLSIKTVVESHAFPDNRSLSLKLMINGLKYLKFFRGLTTISPVLRESFLKRGVPPKKIKVLYDCVDLKLFSRTKNIKSSKNSEFSVLYSGHLYPYKGIDTMLEASKFLPDIKFQILGGNPSDIDALYKKKVLFELNNVDILGFVDFYKVPHFLFKSDLLILPPSLNHQSANFTSPVKLGEYLASRTPILASNIPALVNFLSEEEVFFFKADDPKNLADKILFIKNNYDLAKNKSEKGYQKALKMSYELKAQKIIDISNDL